MRFASDMAAPAPAPGDATGERRHLLPSAAADPRAALSAPPLDVREVRPEVPNILATLIRSTLERDPGARPPAQALVPRLRQLI